MQAQIYPPAPANAAAISSTIRRSLIGCRLRVSVGQGIAQAFVAMRHDADQPAYASRLMFRISNGPFQGGATEWCDTRGACPSALAGIDGSHDVYPHPVIIRLAQHKAFGHFLAHKHATKQQARRAKKWNSALLPPSLHNAIRQR